MEVTVRRTVEWSCPLCYKKSRREIIALNQLLCPECAVILAKNIQVALGIRPKRVKNIDGTVNIIRGKKLPEIPIWNTSDGQPPEYLK